MAGRSTATPARAAFELEALARDGHTDRPLRGGPDGALELGDRLGLRQAADGHAADRDAVGEAARRPVVSHGERRAGGEQDADEEAGQDQGGALHPTPMVRDRRIVTPRPAVHHSPAWRLGKIGIWIRGQDARGEDAKDRVRELEALGYGTLWVGGSPAVPDVRPFLEATETLTVATGILNVWQHRPADVAAQHAELARDFPGRFRLGIGIGHPEATQRYAKPLTTMRAFFDGLDAAERPVPRDERLAAALGPKMLDLAAERSLGTHPYFTPVEHTRFARERVGAGGLVAPGLAVVLEPDPGKARTVARSYAKLLPRAAQLQEQPAAVRLHRGRDRRRRDRPPDRRGRRPRERRADRRGRAGAPRRRGRPRLPPAARPRQAPARRLPGARGRADLVSGGAPREAAPRPRGYWTWRSTPRLPRRTSVPPPP